MTKILQLNMTSKPYLKAFMRVGASKSRRSIGINQEKVDEINDFLQTHLESSVQSVVEAS